MLYGAFCPKTHAGAVERYWCCWIQCWSLPCLTNRKALLACSANVTKLEAQLEVAENAAAASQKTSEKRSSSMARTEKGASTNSRRDLSRKASTNGKTDLARQETQTAVLKVSLRILLLHLWTTSMPVSAACSRLFSGT